ncbi:hypothetical protein A6R68_17797, partial [Neotoma lepida]
APVIAVLGSGGGLRAHIACLGVLSGMKELGLLDAVTYLAGVSGSTWALSSFYTNDGNMEGMEEELKHRYKQNQWHFGESLKKAMQAARKENYSMTDFWAYFVVSRQTRELQDSNLSSIKKQVEEGLLPYPIFAAIDGDLQPDWRKRKTQESWFEFTPHHAGYPALGAFVPITQFGSRFENGKLVRSEPERDLTYLRGQYWDQMEFRGGVKRSTYMESPDMQVEEVLLDLMMAYVKDQNDPSIKDKLRALQQVLSSERGNITDEAMQSREFLHLVDAGLAINTPYPLVLPPAREAHLILSFDFSAGDPLLVPEKKLMYLKEGEEMALGRDGAVQEETQGLVGKYYLQSGHVLVDPPPLLSPESTINCSFVKKSSSFQGTVGILLYQGPSVHLALLFSVPFNYALHRIEFALAIITEPVSRDLERLFNDIIQGKGSPGLKAAKYDLQIPQGTLKLEHDSLIIRAKMSNIHFPMGPACIFLRKGIAEKQR